jgi:sugar phosphate isomerase/epimerase
MGQGMVDWARVFKTFAAAGYTGPMSLHVEYEPKNEMKAIADDLAFMKKQVAAAYAV